MSKNEAVNVEEVDETRVAIESKIDAKRKATGTLVTKSRNLDGQIAQYENAIVNYEEKLQKAKERLEMFKESKLNVAVELETRQEELDHMDEILVRYDKTQKEREKLLAIMRKRIEEVPSWMPGMDDSLKGGINRDPAYQKASTRLEYVDKVAVHALSDVRKIFVSRGVVSGYHERGNKGI